MKLVPKLRDGKFEFKSIAVGTVPSDAHAMIIEEEGMTIVIPTTRDGEDVFAWISLVQETSLTATGITKAFSAALSDAGIPCNVIAAYYHDHMLVPYTMRNKAMQLISEIEI